MKKIYKIVKSILKIWLVISELNKNSLFLFYHISRRSMESNLIQKIRSIEKLSIKYKNNEIKEECSEKKL